MKKIWRQRLLSALLSIFMALAMTGVSVSVRTQAAENNSSSIRDSESAFP